ncbi:MAG: AAA family ATPase [Thermodesulfobacteriota bacterium]|nr:AAA family ATPase [Thermodesulfobacteriota bacterium]
MGVNIAIAGKGGTGKTTITGLLLRNLKETGRVPILAVDADPNSCLPVVLGLKAENTIGRMIAGFIDNKDNVPSGMTKDLYIEMQINKLLIEGDNLDLLVMGRGEGAGCYCYANVILRKFIDNLANSYKYVVIDNEAGLEHLSRRLTDRIDFLLLVSDYSIKGVKTIEQIMEIISELKLDIKSKGLIVNRAPVDMDEKILDAVARTGINLLGGIPFDEKISDFDLQEIPLLELPERSPSNLAAKDIIKNLSLI